MIQIKYKRNCCGCYSCFNACPTGAITMQCDEKGFEYPVIDENKCIQCGLCNKVCPILKVPKEESVLKAYAAINRDETIRMESSSGGIFTVIATHILQLGGVVFGAQFDKEYNVVHSCIEKIEDLNCFRGSKYVQSIIGDTYKQAKNFLEQGRYVLFTGTPCQITGLREFLQKKYDKLYLQDIICHGVPSPKIWRKYLTYREKLDNGKIKNIKFRNKETGWKSYSINFSYSNKEYLKKANEDIYMRAFLKDIILRDSCYHCHFKGKHRVSDITLADFWGIEKVLPKIDDNKGTSLVVIHTKKGQDLFENIKPSIEYEEVNLDSAIYFNPSMIHSASMHKNRKKFFRNSEKTDMEELVKKYDVNPNIVDKILRKTKKIVKKIVKDN